MQNFVKCLTSKAKIIRIC